LDKGTYRGQGFNGCSQQICDSGIRSVFNDTANETLNESLTFNESFTEMCEVCEGNVGLEVNPTTQVVIIVAITLLATASVVAGLKSGIQRLSFIAFGLSAFILFSILFMDETWYIMNVLTSSLGYYLWYLPKISFHTDAWEELDLINGGAPDGRGGKQGWMNTWTIFYWGWWISWGPFVGTFLARISKGRTLGSFIIASLILPSLWSFVFLGIMGAAQIRMSNQAISAGLGGKDIYGSLVNKSAFGWEVDKQWVPVPDQVTRLYALDTEDVLFEHLASYGGHGWATFMTVITLICIVLYFVTSSDSASYVVDIMAANGIEEPPVCQKIFWAFTEGAAACALLLSASEENPKAALEAVKAIPIILGLPFTFLLFWMCQGLLIVCKEEAGTLPIDRKHFSVFLFNIEPNSYLSIPFPFVGAGQVAAKCWDKVDVKPWAWMALFGGLWLSMAVLFILTVADTAFSSMGVSMYVMFAMAVAGLRVATRNKLGISGDMVSDACACCFALPWAIGQMHYEFSLPESNEKSKTTSE